jgi:dCMP deaminase
MSKWCQRFLDLAEHIGEWSYDPRTKLGAVIVDDRNRIISIGYNGFPRGVKDLAKRYEDRPTKHLFVAHAERNALDNSPMSVEGCTMYVPLMPCNECAKSIIQRGIKKVICYDTTLTPSGWVCNCMGYNFHNKCKHIVAVHEKVIAE